MTPASVISSSVFLRIPDVRFYNDNASLPQSFSSEHPLQWLKGLPSLLIPLRSVSIILWHPFFIILSPPFLGCSLYIRFNNQKVSLPYLFPQDQFQYFISMTDAIFKFSINYNYLSGVMCTSNSFLSANENMLKICRENHNWARRMWYSAKVWNNLYTSYCCFLNN